MMLQAAQDFPLWLPFAFTAMWALTAYYRAEQSDWRLLARRYKASMAPDGQSFRGQVYQFGSVSEGNVTRLVVSQGGLYLAPFFIFRIGRSPLLIPWSTVTGVRRGRTFWRSWYALNIDGLTQVRVGEEAFDAMRVYVPVPVDTVA